MQNIHLDNIDYKLYESLRDLARSKERSINEEILYILQKYISEHQSFDPARIDEFLKLAGSWEDDREADEIITDIRKNRKS